MNMTKISADGRIMLPLEIRRILGLKFGDKVTFLQNQEGEIMLVNASAQALQKAQKAFTGAAEILGVKNDDDVQALINEIRYGKI